MIELCLAGALLAGGSFGAVARRPLPARGSRDAIAARRRAHRAAGRAPRSLQPAGPARRPRDERDVPGNVRRAAARSRAHAADRALQVESRRIVALVPRRVRRRIARRLEADADQHAERPAQGGRRVPVEPPARAARGAARRPARRHARRAARAPPPRELAVPAAHQGRDGVRPRRQDDRDGVVLDPDHQGLRLRHARRPQADAGVADDRAADPGRSPVDGGAGVDADRVRLPDRRIRIATRAAT